MACPGSSSVGPRCLSRLRIRCWCGRVCLGTGGVGGDQRSSSSPTGPAMLRPTHRSGSLPAASAKPCRPRAPPRPARGRRCRGQYRPAVPDPGAGRRDPHPPRADRARERHPAVRQLLSTTGHPRAGQRRAIRRADRPAVQSHQGAASIPARLTPGYARSFVGLTAMPAPPRSAVISSPSARSPGVQGLVRCGHVAEQRSVGDAKFEKHQRQGIHVAQRR
jgi:hypothetical protein